MRIKYKIGDKIRLIKINDVSMFFLDKDIANKLKIKVGSIGTIFDISNFGINITIEFDNIKDKLIDVHYEQIEFKYLKNLKKL